MIDAMIQGDASAAKTIARGDAAEPFHRAFRPNTAPLGTAVPLPHDGYGHVSRADPRTCVMQALGRYLVALSPPARGTSCPSDHGPSDPGCGQGPAARGPGRAAEPVAADERADGPSP